MPSHHGAVTQPMRALHLRLVSTDPQHVHMIRLANISQGAKDPACVHAQALKEILCLRVATSSTIGTRGCRRHSSTARDPAYPWIVQHEFRAQFREYRPIPAIVASVETKNQLKPQMGCLPSKNG
jgi:hypothetical protein